MSGILAGLDLGEALATTDAIGIARTDALIDAFQAIETGALKGSAKLAKRKTSSEG